VSTRKVSSDVGNGDQVHPTVKVAIDYLRLALVVLLEHPVYLQALRIDEELLLGKLSPTSSDAMPPSEETRRRDDVQAQAKSGDGESRALRVVEDFLSSL